MSSAYFIDKIFGKTREKEIKISRKMLYEITV